ncbi:MAG: amidohydrolase [Candidatus Njordarchaeales archaeon]
MQNCFERETADIILVNAKVYDPKRDEYFDALAIKEGAIVGIGEDAKNYLSTKTVIVDCRGRMIIPAFIDAHTHILGMAARAGWLDLSKVKSLRELLRIISEYAEKVGPGNWILGHSWDESKWSDEKRYPTKKELDEVAPNNPVFIRRIDGHMAIINSPAMKLLNIPEKIIGLEKDKKGEPTGVIKEHALEYAQRRLEVKFEVVLKGLEKTVKKIQELGISMVHETLSLEQLIILAMAGEKGLIPFTVYGFILVEYLDKLIELGIQRGLGGSKIIIGGVKIFADGSIGARTAALREPYHDDPSNMGILFFSEEELEEIFRKADKAGLQMAIHAIGDRAIDQVIECLAKAQVSKDLRHRIEHFEIAWDEHLKKVKKLGIAISAQPNFVAEWQMPGGMYEKRLGRDRWKIMNPFKKILDEGIPLGFGSDCMPLDPIYGLYGAVSHPVKTNRLSGREALYAYTYGSAFIAHQEDLRGTIEVGKIADLTILSAKNLAEIEKDARNVRSQGLILGGKILRISY